MDSSCGHHMSEDIVMVDSPEQLYYGNMGVPADSRNREMIVASSEQLTVAKVGLCDLAAH